jgi:hypothetical protein
MYQSLFDLMAAADRHETRRKEQIERSLDDLNDDELRGEMEDFIARM